MNNTMSSPSTCSARSTAGPHARSLEADYDEVASRVRPRVTRRLRLSST